MVSPLEQIDFVFFYIKECVLYGGSIGYHNIENRVLETPEMEISVTLLKEILKRLKADGYISEATPADSQPLYHLSFQGFLFDGYKKSQERLQMEDRRVKFLSEKMGRLTTWIMIGTLIAAVYYLLEILNHWFYFFPSSGR